MTTTSCNSTIIRTARGLSIAGTRITLYELMDFVVAGYTPEAIVRCFPVSPALIYEALDYIEANRTEINEEYQKVLKLSAANREYWEQKNRGRFAEIAAMPKDDNAELRALLRAERDRLGMQ